MGLSLLDHLSSPRQIWQISDAKLRSLKLFESVQGSLTENRKKIDLARKMKVVITSGASLITLIDQHYLSPLREIYDPGALTVMVISGKVSDLGGGYFARKS